MIVVTMLEILDIVTISGAGPGRRLATILGIVPAQARRPPRIFVRASRGERRHMAQKVLIQLVDDLDGTASVGVAKVEFGLDGVTYEVDLSADNAERIRTMFGEYIPHARRTGGRLNRGTSAGASRSSDASEASAIREWAQQNGIELAARGRIPGHVVEKYQDAKQAAVESPKKARATKRRTKATAN
jgi:hypothetical protein